MQEHDHKFERLDVGPPKMFVCVVRGCDARVPVDPATKGPDLKERKDSGETGSE